MRIVDEKINRINDTKKPLINLRNVTRKYVVGHQEILALNNITLEIFRGEFVVVLGPSGSGKTTLLNTIGGIDKATNGKVIVNDVDISKLPERKLTKYRRIEVGFVFQFFNLISTLTSLENVQYVTELAGVPKRPDKRSFSRSDINKQSITMLENVELGDKSNFFPSQLSGGEQQRVAVARALAKAPILILCDEPTGELDEVTGWNVLKTIKRIVLERNQTVILVTHNQEITKLATRVIRMSAGSIIENRIQKPQNVEDIKYEH